jgi:hypothetical protein
MSASLLIMLMLSIGACADRVLEHLEDSTVPHDGPAPASSLQYAEGWSEIVIIANYARTTVTPAAHFATSRNGCGKEEYGAIGLEDWNALAKTINSAVLADLLTEETCFPMPDDIAKMDGTVELILASSTPIRASLVQPEPAPSTMPTTIPAPPPSPTPTTSPLPTPLPTPPHFPIPSPVPFPSPTPSPTVPKRALFSTRGYKEICTVIRDRALALALLKEIDKIVITADKANCPNGWGSG